MPTIGESVRGLQARLFVGRQRELARFQTWLDSDTELPEILDVSGPGGVGKTALLGAFRRSAEQRGRKVVLLDGRDLRPTPEGLVGALGGGSLPGVLRRLNAERALLLLDTFEALGDLSTYLREAVLAELDSAVKVAVAGRYPLVQLWGRDPVWHQLIQPLPLDALPAADARLYLERRGVADPALREQIVEMTGGHPLGLSLAADLVRQRPVRDLGQAQAWPLVVRSLAERLLHETPDPELRPLLEAAAAVRQFDEPLLGAVAGLDQIGAAFDRLCRLSVVRPSRHGLLLHDDVRRILAQDLRWRDAARYAALRQRALHAYGARMRDAAPAEREWLLGERLYLWEHGFVQAVLFGQDDLGEVLVEPGRDADIPEVLQVEAIWHTAIVPTVLDVDYSDDPDGSQHLAYMERLLRCPGRRLKVARSPEGAILGYTLALPIYGESVATLGDHGWMAPLVHAYFRQTGAPVPASPESSRTWYFVQIGHRGEQVEAVTAALWRDVFGVLTLGDTFLVSVALPEQKQLFEAFGFERVPGAIGQSWVKDQPIEGFLLDLSRIGLELWIEAVMAGRRPPRPLPDGELEGAVQAALAHWHEPGWLERSPLATSAEVARLAPGRPGADAVRQALLEALEAARARSGPDRDLALRAVELAYVRNGLSHEATAEQLAVSRTTFYRLLKRGAQALAKDLSLASAPAGAWGQARDHPAQS